MSTYIIAKAGVKDHLHFLISDSLEEEPSVILIFRDCSAVKRDDVLILFIPEPEFLQGPLNCRVSAAARRHELDAHFRRSANSLKISCAYPARVPVK